MTSARWELDGKVILITGGARGIGAATAGELARRGAVPVLADVDEVALAKSAATIGRDVLTVVADVTDLASCDAAVATAVERHGRLDGVWANAGIGAGGPVELMDPAAWVRVIEVNLVGAFNTVRAALPEVIKARGHIAITASLASFAHGPMMSAYSASKAGVEAFADALRTEVAHQGVTVSVLHPSWIGTDMVREADAESDAFAVLRKSLRPPFAKTYPVEAIIGPIADGLAARSPRIFLPGFVRLAYRLRNRLNAGPVLRDQLKVAPEIHELFRAQAEREGVRQTSLGSRWNK
jgi:NAD(P)-dependent dehydrogenase (short-subunit alcohol dehydrogenase family)